MYHAVCNKWSRMPCVCDRCINLPCCVWQVYKSTMLCVTGVWLPDWYKMLCVWQVCKYSMLCVTGVRVPDCDTGCCGHPLPDTGDVMSVQNQVSRHLSSVDSTVTALFACYLASAKWNLCVTLKQELCVVSVRVDVLQRLLLSVSHNLRVTVYMSCALLVLV